MKFLSFNLIRFSSLVLLIVASILPLQSSYGVYGTELYWPTPNKAFLEKSPSSDYLQATESGRIESGNWGCTRNGGKRFHEGVDLKSILRNRNGISQDKVIAAASGTVAHVNEVTGNSSYGKYIVLSHVRMGIEWCTLYAHLESIDRSILQGSKVNAGQVIGTMGRTSSSIKIPESRAHLHFEVVLRQSSNFQTWYQKQAYGSPNKHGSWNGMNLTGVDPFEFYNYFIDNPEAEFFSFFLKEPVSFEILTYFNQTPDFLLRNPIFLRGKPLPQTGSWYQIGFTWYGLPASWQAIPDKRIDKRLNRNAIHIKALRHEKSCRNWIDDMGQKGLVARNLLKKHIAILKAGDQ